MEIYSQEELKDALVLVSSTIIKCEKMQLKFAEGTSQHSLLKNRIKALHISKSLLSNDGNIGTYTHADLGNALPPVISIINKTEKAKSKYDSGTTQHKRFMPIIKAMYISKTLIENEMSQRN